MKKKQYYNFLKPPEGNCCKLCDFSFSLLQDSSNNIPLYRMQIYSRDTGYQTCSSNRTTQKSHRSNDRVAKKPHVFLALLASHTTQVNRRQVSSHAVPLAITLPGAARSLAVTCRLLGDTGSRTTAPPHIASCRYSLTRGAAGGNVLKLATFACLGMWSAR